MPPATPTRPDLPTFSPVSPPVPTGPRPLAARLDAEPGWNALVMETRPDGTFTGRVLFLPIRAWGVLLPATMTAPAVVREVLGKFTPLGASEVIPLAASASAPVLIDRRVMDEPGFRLLCPPGESFTAAVARAEQAQLHLEAMAAAAKGENHPIRGVHADRVVVGDPLMEGPDAAR